MTMLSPIEQAAVAHVGAAPLLAQVQEWAAINSGTRTLPGLATGAARLADAAAVLPGDLAMVEPAPVEAVDGAGVARPLEHGQHLHLTVRPDAPLQLLFTGHMDTVYPANHPFQDQRFLADGTLNGPGVADMKSGLALMLAALQAVEATPLAARIGYEVVINSDEEPGPVSSSALLAQAARGKLAALTYEPALPDGTLAGARGGSGNFSVVVRGRSAHAGRNPEEGRNAIVAAADLALRLAQVRSPGLAVNPAKIEGGGPNNVVPDLAVLRGNFRPASAEDIGRAQSAIDAAVAMVAAEHEVEISVHGSFNRPPRPIDEGAAKLYELD